VRRGAAAVVVGLAAALLSPAATQPSSAAAEDRPNVLVFMTDDQTLGTLSVMPAVQALKARGTSYTRYYDSNPLCCPARAALLTGQYSHNNGVWDNNGSLGGYQAMTDKDNTLATWLHDSGYQTGILGKFLNGYRYDIDGVPQGWDRWRVAEGRIYHYYDTRVRDEDGELTDYGDTRYKTDLYADLAVDLIDEFDTDTPWFLWLTPNAPHAGAPLGELDRPYVKTCSPSPAWAGWDADARLPRQKQFNEANVSDKPRHIRKLPLITPAQHAILQAAFAEHLECLRSVDEYLQRVVGHLAAIGELDTTDILFMSDNGYAFGEHRVPSGKRLPYTYASKLPLVAAGPDFAIGVDGTPRSSVDLAATIVELTDAVPGRELDGTSLLVTGDPARAIVHEGRAVKKPFRIEQYGALRTSRWLYAEYRYTDGSWDYELYSVEDDPSELRSLARDRAQKTRMARLAARLHKLSSCFGIQCP
jgi:N-acetylglucosamine-6-sulfatase